MLKTYQTPFFNSHSCPESKQPRLKSNFPDVVTTYELKLNWQIKFVNTYKIAICKNVFGKIEPYDDF